MNGATVALVPASAGLHPMEMEAKRGSLLEALGRPRRLSRVVSAVLLRLFLAAYPLGGAGAEVPAPAAASATTATAPAGIPAPEGRRVEVLFLGSENRFGHDPAARFRVIRQALGPAGINFTYRADLGVLNRDELARFDVLLIFANHETIAPEQGEALLGFARGGGGCVLLHCAAGCFRGSGFDGYVELLGAQFKSHGAGVFRPETVAPDHPLMRGYAGFECWDESYVHHRHVTAGRTVLQVRGEEPWTWVKTYGQGRVFYTASGHDHRCWELPQYHDLLRRAVLWTAGEELAAGLGRLGLPELRYRPAAVPKDPDNPVGPINQQQLPLAPADSLKLAQVPPGFELRVFAAEPEVVNPIALNWDGRGRLWVVEAFDYPHKIATDEPQDRIKILEDTDGDGDADDVSVFAEGLNICTSVLPMPGGGAIATDGDRMVYLHDRDGDGEADEREVLFSGISLRDTHACTSNLRYGFDNWIYATVGYSGIKTTVGGARHETGAGVFRFRPDGSALEVLQNTSNNTWGLGFTAEGDVVGSTANDNPSWFLTIPNRYFRAAGLEPRKVPRADRKERLHPVTADYFQNWPKERCSSGAGHSVYAAGRFPEGWRGRRVFICEPPLHLVAAPRFEEEGAGFATTGFEDNLYASADAWSAPVAAEVGPDGAVWVADWYNPICNHNPYRKHQRRGPGNAFVTDDRDRSHGRIYRIFPRGTKGAPQPEIGAAAGAVAALGHPDLFWRLAAQRRLVYGDGGTEVVDELMELAERGEAPASLHALHALQGLHALDGLGRGGRVRFQMLAEKLVGSPARGLAAAALGLLRPGSARAGIALASLEDPGRHPRMRLHAALALAEEPPDPNHGARLARLFLAGEKGARLGDPHFRAAVELAVLRHPEGFVRHLVEARAEVSEDTPLAHVVAMLAAQLEAGRARLSPGLVTFAAESGAALGKRFAGAVEKAGTGVTLEAVPAKLSASAFRGSDTYLACVACHQPDGRGLPGTFPPLDGSPLVRGADEALVRLVLHGLKGRLERGGQSYDAVMLGHAETLSDREIADVLSYVRGAWSNRAGDVSTDTVAAQRAATDDRVAPYTPEELTAPE